MTNIWPELGAEKEIATFSANGEFSEARTVEAKAWTPDSPELYALRFVAIRDGAPVADAVVETGFRTITQKDGKFLLNGEPIVLKGNLIMQYLPPYEEIPLTHICPRSEQIAWQYQMNKNLNGNTIRLHILGYGTNDERFARYADRMGVMLIWITRYIDGVAQVAWDEVW
jgi:beta-galactosidase/beta-glucuronidase